MAGRAYKRTSRGTRITRHGVRVTASQYRRLQYYVRRSNILRERDLASASPERRQDWEVMKSRQGDFVLSKKRTDISRFKSQKQFNEYYKRLQQIVSGTYQSRQNRVYRSNLVASLQKKFGSTADDLIKNINKLNSKEIRDLTLSDKLHDIGWIYNEPKNDNVKFAEIENQINNIISRR